MKRLLAVLAFVVFSLVLVKNSLAAPLPPGAPAGNFITDGMAIAFIAGYGLWRMRKK